MRVLIIGCGSIGARAAISYLQSLASPEAPRITQDAELRELSSALTNIALKYQLTSAEQSLTGTICGLLLTAKRAVPRAEETPTQDDEHPIHTMRRQTFALLRVFSDAHAMLNTTDAAFVGLLGDLIGDLAIVRTQRRLVARVPLPESGSYVMPKHGPFAPTTYIT